MAIKNEMGNPANPLKITWLLGVPSTCKVAPPTDNNVC